MRNMRGKGGVSLQLNCLNGPRHFLPWKISGVKVKMKLENDRNIQYPLCLAQNFSGNQWPDPQVPQMITDFPKIFVYSPVKLLPQEGLQRSVRYRPNVFICMDPNFWGQICEVSNTTASTSSWGWRVFGGDWGSIGRHVGKGDRWMN